MSNLGKILDLSMFGCPVHKTKALAAAQQLAIGETLRLKVNNDAVSNVVQHLTTNAFHCETGAPDVLTTMIKVTRND